MDVKKNKTIFSGFSKKNEPNRKKEAEELVVEIFGVKQLEGNLSLANVIRYN
jgi:hypothetical protein